MPKTLLEKIVFTIIMAAIMVYGMIVYNVALNTGGVTNATFAMALHEMPIMVPAAFILEFFVKYVVTLFPKVITFNVQVYTSTFNFIIEFAYIEKVCHDSCNDTPRSK